jgi:type IV pilus assembly protein PilX
MLKPTPIPGRQRGAVLLIALIMLVAMTLGGIALIRSVYTSNLVAGNLSFQQAAVLASDRGVEAAVKWLENTKTVNAANLYDDNTGAGYFASRIGGNPASGQSWDEFWNDVLRPVGVRAVAPDATGNTIEYVIHRLCDNKTSPTGGNPCSLSPSSVGARGNDKGAGVVGLQYNNQVYYRITVRVAGPRNTVSFTQAVVAL